MKKSTLRRLMVLALCLTLVTCTLVGGTLAKYTTTASASDSARVAEWGVTITTASDTGFKKEYAKTAETTLEKTVVAEVNVVAPGTGGTLTDVTLSGSPEVAVKVDYSAELSLSNWTVPKADSGTEDYCPIVFTVEGVNYKMGTGTDTATDKFSNSVTALETAVEGAIAAESAEYAANTNLSTIGTDAPSVSWAWAFEGNDDTKDTILGNQAAAATEESKTAATISLTVTTTVTQID